MTLNKQHFFITGTDTDVGKTFVSAALLARATQQGQACFGVKPVTAGCERIADIWHSQDADTLAAASSVQIHADLLAPVKLATACSPNIAAAIDGKNLQAARIAGMVRGALANRASHVLVEGAGGWYTPINNKQTLADVAKALKLPVILVVGIKLGCLNHTLLSVQAIQSSGLTLVGWVANETQADTPFFSEQVTTLKAYLAAPNLGVLRFGCQQEAVQQVVWPNELSAVL